MSLSGKVAIVTGSGRGLGLAYARELALPGEFPGVSEPQSPTASGDNRYFS